MEDAGDEKFQLGRWLWRLVVAGALMALALVIGVFFASLTYLVGDYVNAWLFKVFELGPGDAAREELSIWKILSLEDLDQSAFAIGGLGFAITLFIYVFRPARDSFLQLVKFVRGQDRCAALGEVFKLSAGTYSVALALLLTLFATGTVALPENTLSSGIGAAAPATNEDILVAIDHRFREQVQARSLGFFRLMDSGDQGGEAGAQSSLPSLSEKIERAEQVVEKSVSGIAQVEGVVNALTDSLGSPPGETTVFGMLQANAGQLGELSEDLARQESSLAEQQEALQSIVNQQNRAIELLAALKSSDPGVYFELPMPFVAAAPRRGDPDSGQPPGGTPPDQVQTAELPLLVFHLLHRRVGDSGLDEGAIARLGRIVDALAACLPEGDPAGSRVRLNVVGYASSEPFISQDSDGEWTVDGDSPEKNRALAMARANAIRDALAGMFRDRGFGDNRVSITVNPSWRRFAELESARRKILNDRVPGLRLEVQQFHRRTEIQILEAGAATPGGR